MHRASLDPGEQTAPQNLRMYLRQLHKCSWGNQSCLPRCGSSRDKERSCSSTRRKTWGKRKTPSQISVPIQSWLPDYSSILIFQHCKKSYNYLQTSSLSSFFSCAPGAGSSPVTASVHFGRWIQILCEKVTQSTAAEITFRKKKKTKNLNSVWESQDHFLLTTYHFQKETRCQCCHTYLERIYTEKYQPLVPSPARRCLQTFRYELCAWVAATISYTEQMQIHITCLHQLKTSWQSTEPIHNCSLGA